MGAHKGRINTQVRRRLKVHETTPLESEWDEQSGRESTDLRMPADRMVSRPSVPHAPTAPSSDSNPKSDPQSNSSQPS